MTPEEIEPYIKALPLSPDQHYLLVIQKDVVGRAVLEHLCLPKVLILRVTDVNGVKLYEIPAKQPVEGVK